jgi:phosphatidylglycerophosphate synthase
LKTPQFVTQYTHSLKNPWAEEIVDLLLFRPLAFIFVKFFYPFPVTPNQISLMAMVAGATAGYCFSAGDPRGLALGSAAYLLYNVLDCADGMIARLKRNGTKTGRIVDGMIDYVVGAAVYIGLGIGLTKAGYRLLPGFRCDAWIIVLVAAASTAAQTMASDRYSRLFLAHEYGTSTTSENEIETFAGELQRLNAATGHTLDKLLIKFYLRYSWLQAGTRPARPAKPKTKPTRLMMALWNLIGPSTHVTALVVAGILNRPTVFFAYAIGVANVWMVLMLGLQTFTGRKAAARIEGQGISPG